MQGVLFCTAPIVQDSACAWLTSSSRDDPRWNTFARLARQHGLSPLVYARLDELRLDIQNDALLQLKADARALVQRVLILVGEMNHLVRLLQTHNIETLVIKGPALSCGLYGGLARRAFLDLDLMVRPQDFEKAWNLLAAEGYTSAYNISPAHLPALFASGNHLPLYGYANHELIELHWAFFPRSRATPFDTEGAWNRREALQIGDTNVMTLAPCDLVHFLCLHGTKHAWFRLSWITDLAWFGFRYPAFDWDSLLDYAAQLGTRRMTLVGLALARELYGLALTEGTARQIRNDRQVLPLAAWMWRRTLCGAQYLPTGTELVPFVLRTRERTRDGLRDLYHHLMAPRPNNLQDAPLAASMLRTYPLHRLWYLLLKYSRVRA